MSSFKPGSHHSPKSAIPPFGSRVYSMCTSEHIDDIKTHRKINQSIDKPIDKSINIYIHIYIYIYVYTYVS